MRTDTRPLAYHLSWLVIASLVPAAWVAAALAASLFDPAWPSALALMTGVMALAVGAFVSVLIATSLRRTLVDLASEASMLRSGRALVRLEPAVREFAAIADALAAIAARARDSADGRAEAADRGTFHWDLATGAMAWTDDVGTLLELREGTSPSSARLLARAHPADRAPLATWLASLARGEEVEPLEFRTAREDGATRTIRAQAASERDGDGAPVRICGRFELVADDRPAPRQPCAPMPIGARMLDAAAVMERVAAAARQRASMAGVDIVLDAAADLAPVGGDEGALEAALACLVDNAVTFTPRAGRIVLRAGWDANGDLRIALGAVGPATVTGALVVDGMGIAGNMIELGCGARAAMSVAEARCRIEALGGKVLVQRGAGEGDSVTIVLPGRGAVRAAA
ncbi:MAG TPA: hypothetical protein VN802_17600 [Stellaceae bacterium]|nr:hypothetical protein [Stellaceae bacterium]